MRPYGLQILLSMILITGLSCATHPKQRDVQVYESNVESQPVSIPVPTMDRTWLNTLTCIQEKLSERQSTIGEYFKHVIQDKGPSVIFFAEQHDHYHAHQYLPVLLQFIQTIDPAYNCLFVEVDSRVQDLIDAFQNHTMSYDAVRDQMIARSGVIGTGLRRNMAEQFEGKIIAMDKLLPPASIPTLLSRDSYMQHVVQKYLRDGICQKAFVQVGKIHVIGELSVAGLLCKDRVTCHIVNMMGKQDILLRNINTCSEQYLDEAFSFPDERFVFQDQASTVLFIP